MRIKDPLKHMAKGIPFTLLGTLISFFLLSGNGTGTSPSPEARMTASAATANADAATELKSVSSATASAAPTDIFCTPVQVVTFPNRIHVKCASDVGGIVYFAVSTANAEYANRVLSMLTTAQVAGRTLIIRYDPADTSGASFGCLTSDCRPILGVGFGQ